MSASVHAGIHPPDQADPPRADTPWTRQTPPHREQTPPRPGRHPPRTRQTPPQNRQTPPPQSRQTPPREADSSIRSTSGRYASYWNAFLLNNKKTTGKKKDCTLCKRNNLQKLGVESMSYLQNIAVKMGHLALQWLFQSFIL